MTGQYHTIVADPPWPQKGCGTALGRVGWVDSGGAAKPLPYSTMTVAEITALTTADLIADDAHLYLWTTNGFLPEAFPVMRAWGFKYSTTLVWAKNPMGGGLGGAYGISTEYCLHGRRGTLPALARVRGTWFNWKRPYKATGGPMNSAKPREFYEMVEGVSPGPRLELFARETRPGWDCWGDQAPEPIAWSPR